MAKFGGDCFDVALEVEVAIKLHAKMAVRVDRAHFFLVHSQVPDIWGECHLERLRGVKASTCRVGPFQGGIRGNLEWVTVMLGRGSGRCSDFCSNGGVIGKEENVQWS